MSENDDAFREKRQCQGGSVMIWVMVMPNGLLTHKIINGILKSNNYLQLLKDTVFPILCLNYGNNAVYQDDNCSVHRAAKVKEFWQISKIQNLKWPSRSPDLNITEDVWKLISDSVYDGPQFKSKDILINKINIVINDINRFRREEIRKLFCGFTTRLCKVLRKNGNLYNK